MWETSLVTWERTPGCLPPELPGVVIGPDVLLIPTTLQTTAIFTSLNDCCIRTVLIILVSCIQDINTQHLMDNSTERNVTLTVWLMTRTQNNKTGC